MIEEYRYKKKLENIMANADDIIQKSMQTQAAIDYNIMMGNLEDPEREANDE